MNLATAWALARKDIRLLLRDRTALFFAFALPILLSSVMGSALGAAMSGGGDQASRPGPKEVQVAVEDRAEAEASRASQERTGAAEGPADTLGPAAQDSEPKSSGGIPRKAGASHAFASMAVMMLLFNLVAAAGTLQDERAEGTLDRLRLTPSAGSSILLGKTLVTMTMASTQLAVLFAFGALVYKIPVMEHPLEIAVVSLVWAFTASALGLLFATSCATRKQLEGLSTLVILGMSAVGGAWFPREITPAWFQTAGLVTPVAWAMDAYEGVLWYGKSFAGTAELGGIGGKLVVLMAFGIAMFAVSVVMYRRRFLRA